MGFYISILASLSILYFEKLEGNKIEGEKSAENCWAKANSVTVETGGIQYSSE